MNFIATDLEGAYIIEIEAHEDERGFFARAWCEDEFLEHGLNPKMKQCNISFNHKKGTLRGMHYQMDPYGEVKIVRCTKGAIFDVVIDLRLNSSTYKQHVSVELNEENRRMLYIPEGFAHGFQTLEDNTEVFYQMASSFVPEAANGVRWNDSVFNIKWPEEKNRVISARDKTYADFS